SLSLLLGVTALFPPDSRQEVKTITAAASKAAEGPAKQAVKRMDLSTGVNVNLPGPKRDLEAASFGTSDGRSGGVLGLRGGRPVVVDERRGRLVWQEWLGVTLMSQPASDKGVLYTAHPAATGRPAKRAEFHPQAAWPGGSHRLLAADLKTGRHIWEQEISGDVITAPVISDGTVYFTTFDGNSYALNATDGSVV